MTHKETISNITIKQYQLVSKIKTHSHRKISLLTTPSLVGYVFVYTCINEKLTSLFFPSALWGTNTAIGLSTIEFFDGRA